MKTGDGSRFKAPLPQLRYPVPFLAEKVLRFLLSAIPVVLLVSSCAERSAPDIFVNQVWKVSESSAVARDSLYVFLSEGTLVITSPNSKPALGTWKYEKGTLTMVEESIPYTVDILKLSRNEFRIRSNNPGKPVTITFIPANGRTGWPHLF